MFLFLFLKVWEPTVWPSNEKYHETRMLVRQQVSLDLFIKNARLTLPWCIGLQLGGTAASACKELLSIQGKEMAQNEA